MKLLRSLAFVVLLAAAPRLAAQSLPPQPPPPKQFRAVVRYDIVAPRDTHVRLYDELVADLRELGFTFEPPLEKRPPTDREDPTKNLFVGTIEPGKALRILQEQTIASLLLIPEDGAFKLPDDPAEPVHVRLQLAGSLALDRQRELSEQATAILRLLGFREAVGYDTRGYDGRPFTRLVGTVPRGVLETLLKDLRNLPGGWLAPVIPRGALPTPLRRVNPVRVIEVLRVTGPLKEVAAPARRKNPAWEKIAPDLWTLVNDKEKAGQRVRVQIVLAGAPTDGDPAWRARLVEAAPDLFLEGRLAQFVTALCPVETIKALAALPEVSVVRRPRPGQIEPAPTRAGADNAQALAKSGLTALHKRGARGKGVRLAIVDTDFRGWDRLVAKKQLPAGTRLVDLTAERSPQLQPAPTPGPADGIGHGTRAAQAAALAAPEAEIVLVRIGGIAPFRLYEVARYLQGDYLSPLIERRRDELTTGRAMLLRRRAELLKERRAILESFTDETDLREDLGFLGSVFGWLYSEREWHRARMAHQQAQEDALRELEDRFGRLVDELRGLRGISVAACPLLWQDGYPLADGGPLGQWFAALRLRGPLWFQSAGNVRRQCWEGPFRTQPGATALVFTDPLAKLPPGRWTAALNFLAWQPAKGDETFDLPAKTRVRISMQWQEPHDPDYFLRPGEQDFYAHPLATLRLTLLRQHDPGAKQVPADTFDVVARSGGLPQRLEYRPGGAVYEVTLETTLEAAGRYALRVDRQPATLWITTEDPERKTPVLEQLRDLNPTGIRPHGAPTLPALETRWELRPRLYVTAADEATRSGGRIIFGDFFTEAGSIGLPAGGRGLVSVGAVNLKDQARRSSAAGAPPFAPLASRPALWTYDALELADGSAGGADVAAPFAAGAAAALLSGGMTRAQLVQLLHAQQGRILRVTETKAP